MAKSNWEFLHDEEECRECERREDYGKINCYEGTYRGQYSFKYECSNPKCSYKLIKTEKQMRQEEGI